jgi:hypothetical protein
MGIRVSPNVAGLSYLWISMPFAFPERHSGKQGCREIAWFGHYGELQINTDNRVRITQKIIRALISKISDIVVRKV